MCLHSTILQKKINQQQKLILSQLKLLIFKINSIKVSKNNRNLYGYTWFSYWIKPTGKT